MEIQITNSQTWRDGRNVITVETSNTERAFGMRMLVNGKSDHGWVFHNPPEVRVN